MFLPGRLDKGGAGTALLAVSDGAVASGFGPIPPHAKHAAVKAQTCTAMGMRFMGDETPLAAVLDMTREATTARRRRQGL
jgi:hypothetical protein